MITTVGRFEIDDDPARVDRDAVWRYLSTEAYWGRDRSRADVEAQLDGAWRVVAAYDGDGATIGFARAVSDGVAFAYLADVFVLSDYRGQGLATWLVGTALTHPALAGLRRVLLATRDAHALYARFGFEPLARPERFMEIHKPDVDMQPGG